MKKQCEKCKGEGFILVDETPEECSTCEGTGEVEEQPDYFQMFADLVKPINKVISQLYQ